MLRVRFKTTDKDYRPVKWPIPHPYWCTGSGEGYNILVAYADNEAQITERWPDAFGLEAEEAIVYVFTSRFPRPQWFKG
jgi:hypothetical protein